MKFSFSAPRVYCLISRFPFFELHFSVLYKILGIERETKLENLQRQVRLMGEATNLRASEIKKEKNKTVKDTNYLNIRTNLRLTPLRTSRPKKGHRRGFSMFNWSPQNDIEEEKKEEEAKREETQKETKKLEENKNQDRKNTENNEKDQSGSLRVNTIDTNNQVIKLLVEYHKLEAKPGEFETHLTGLRTFVCKEGHEQELIKDWTLPTIFRLLSIKSIILLLRALFCENSIIIVCDNLGILSNIVLSCIALLYPFVWQGPMIPILPNSLSECIQSPVPYIIGMQKLGEIDRCVVGDQCLIVDVAEHKLTLPKDDLYPLPNEKDLKFQLMELGETLSSKKEIDRKHYLLHPSNTTNEEIKAVQNIYNALMVYKEKLIEEIIFYSSVYAIATSNPSYPLIHQEQDSFKHPTRTKLMHSSLNNLTAPSISKKPKLSHNHNLCLLDNENDPDETRTDDIDDNHNNNANKQDDNSCPGSNESPPNTHKGKKNNHKTNKKETTNNTKNNNDKNNDKNNSDQHNNNNNNENNSDNNDKNNTDSVDNGDENNNNNDSNSDNDDINNDGNNNENNNDDDDDNNKSKENNNENDKNKTILPASFFEKSSPFVVNKNPGLHILTKSSLDLSPQCAYPSLLRSSFDFSDLDSIHGFITIFPLSEQNFISKLIQTQHSCVYFESYSDITKLNKSENVITEQTSLQFSLTIVDMINSELGQQQLALSMLSVYTDLQDHNQIEESEMVVANSKARVQLLKKANIKMSQALKKVRFYRKSVMKGANGRFSFSGGTSSRAEKELNKFQKKMGFI